MPEKKDDKQLTFKIIGVLLILVFSSSIKAQYFGIRGGANICSLVGEEILPTASPMLRFNSGLFMEYQYTPYTSFVFEVNYTQKGAFLRDSIPGLESGYYEVNEKMSYLNVPIIYRIKFGNKKFNFYTDWGASVSLLLDTSRSMYSENMGMPIKRINNNYEQSSKLFELGAVFGIGMRYRIVSLDFRYDAAISNIYGGDSPISARHSVFSFNLGLRFFKID